MSCFLTQKHSPTEFRTRAQSESWLGIASVLRNRPRPCGYSLKPISGLSSREANFRFEQPAATQPPPPGLPLDQHIINLWPMLERKAAKPPSWSSLLPL